MANVLRRWWPTALLLVLAPGLLFGTATPPSDAAPHKKKPPCATDLASCPKTGCALLDDDKTDDERAADALLNRLKQTTSTNGTPIRVSTIFAGFIRSEMNEKAKNTPFIVDTATGCRAIVRAIERERPEAYVPRWPWAPLRLLLRHLPLPVVARMF